MGKPATLLEGICGYALSIGAPSIEVETEDGKEWVYANHGNTSISIASYKTSSADAKELRANLYAAAKKPVRTVIDGHVYLLKVGISESFGEDTFLVSIDPAPKRDPSVAPSFTAKTRSIPCVHLSLHQAPPPGTRGDRPPAILSRFRARGSRHG
jgi:hypothetical protein